jgi:hypothetical protein
MKSSGVRVFSLDDIKADGRARQLRYCTAWVSSMGGYVRKRHAKLVSYSTLVIWLYYDRDSGEIIEAHLYPFISITTYSHVRKFLAMFPNGKEVYKAYKLAAKARKNCVYVG